MKCLITGVTGFAGSHLADLLLSQGHMVGGISRQSKWPLGAEHLNQQVQLFRADVADPKSVADALRRFVPDQVYHLAGQASVPESYRDPIGTRRSNFDGAKSVFESVKEHCPSARVLFASTAHIYAVPAEGDPPINEQSRIEPANPYSTSKAEADRFAVNLATAGQCHIVVARPSNHLGPRQQTTFAIANFARQIAEIERDPNRPKILRTGNLDVERDFTDVRDVCRAYVSILEVGTPGEVFNIAAGETHSVRSLLDEMLANSNPSIVVETDPNLVRGNEPKRIAFDPSHLCKRTGWSTQVSVRRTLTDTLNDWCIRVNSAAM